VLLLVFVLAQALLMPLLLTGWMLWIPAVGVSLIAFSLAQFLADRFIVEGEKLLTTGSAHVNNMALLDIIGLISVAAGCAAMGVGVYLAADGAGRSSQMLAGLLVLSLGSLAIPFAVFAFCPHLVGVTTSSNASAGDEAIGLLSFAIRSSLALASFWYLFVGVWSLVGLLLAVVVSIDSGAVASTVFGATVLAMLAGAVLPLLLYVSYLMLALGVDLVRAFLNIRQNVEALAERRAAD
jgi:hypothetical protein